MAEKWQELMGVRAAHKGFGGVAVQEKGRRGRRGSSMRDTISFNPHESIISSMQTRKQKPRGESGQFTQ